jgi:hypothetical protein
VILSFLIDGLWYEVKRDHYILWLLLDFVLYIVYIEAEIKVLHLYVVLYQLRSLVFGKEKGRIYGYDQ